MIVHSPKAYVLYCITRFFLIFKGIKRAIGIKQFRLKG